MENTNTDFEVLKKQALFKRLSDQELKIILNHIQKKKYEADETITREGDESTEIYFISEGEVRILKLDEDGVFNLALGKLQAGDMFGEMSFIDAAPRSSTIETTKRTTVFELSIEKLDQSSPEMKDIFNKLIHNIAAININRLRSSNETQVKTLRTSLRKFKIKENWGKFLIALFLIVGVLNFVFHYFNGFLPWVNSDLYKWAYWWVLGLMTYVTMMSFHLYKDDFGVKLDNLRTTAYQSLGIIFAGIIALSLFYHLQMGSADLEPFGILGAAGYFLYCCAYEFVGRGVFISLFRRFFEDERGALSVLLSACFLTFIPLTAYLQFDHMNVFFFFVLNLAMGTIYLVQGNLLGVICIHFVLGLYARYLQLV